ncbi:conserved protein of unknown function [Pseudomonas putida KT2440]|uniref:Uncharacterized protein n=1 Tax=Pseudomonas putida (strain ATCC 47054 / DSM 6125 / CFBP 8728 / NCIMB 11950 / KT2440) TaxID=160488 RepID=Q88KE8_PSEPK|nr:conserved protein of unknown function [Pseudomonas putida KT2440]
MGHFSVLLTIRKCTTAALFSAPRRGGTSRRIESVPAAITAKVSFFMARKSSLQLYLAGSEPLKA